MSIGFKYACFISYSHGEQELVKGFIDQFKAALKAYLEPFMDEEVYVDVDRLKAGFKYNEALAQAICQSVCMVVVYSPVYERRPYCGREYEAMERLEAKRLAMLAGKGSSKGLIIPVVLRGFAQLPERIQQHRQAIDFSHFTLATPEMSRNPDFVARIEEIAKQIYEHFSAFSAAGDDPCDECMAFSLPAEGDVTPWRPLPATAQPAWQPAFPNR
jgi:hypothetical protein